VTTWFVSKILAAVDFSRYSEAVLEHALAIADLYAAEVHVMHAWQIPPIASPELLAAGPAGVLGFDEHVRAEAERTLRNFVAPFASRRDLRIHTCLALGEPAERIVSLAKDGDYDLIVMGTHGRTGLDRFVMGSIAEKVVRRATCPVLTVRDRSKEAA
jgi:nucleotide-binding universal stress UspA family protein